MTAYLAILLWHNLVSCANLNIFKWQLYQNSLISSSKIKAVISVNLCIVQDHTDQLHGRALSSADQSSVPPLCKVDHTIVISHFCPPSQSSPEGCQAITLLSCLHCLTAKHNFQQVEMIKTSLPGPDLQLFINSHEDQITVNQKWSCCFQLPQCCSTKAHTTPWLSMEQQEETFPSSSTISITGISLETDITMKTAQLYTKSYTHQI